MDQILRMIFQMVTRRMVHKAISTGMDKAVSMGRQRGQSPVARPSRQAK